VQKKKRVFFFCTTEPQPNLAKQSSARRVQYKIKSLRIFIFIAEPPPNLAKQSSARRAQYKIKSLGIFIFPQIRN